MNQNGNGYSVITTSKVLGTSGSDTVVYGVNIISDGTTGTVILRNGISAGATQIVKLTGIINAGVYIDFGCGIVFSGGCFVSIDAHVTPSCTVVYEQI